MAGGWVGGKIKSSGVQGNLFSDVLGDAWLEACK